MGIPSASHSITMRLHLGADPLGIGRITTAVHRQHRTVLAAQRTDRPRTANSCQWPVMPRSAWAPRSSSR
jgi:hypothetical protein